MFVVHFLGFPSPDCGGRVWDFHKCLCEEVKQKLKKLTSKSYFYRENSQVKLSNLFTNGE